MSKYLIVAKKPSAKMWRYLQNQDCEILAGIDSGGAFLIKKKFAMELLVGDFDNMKASDRGLIDNYSGNIIYLSPEKDVTDLEYAIKKIGGTHDIVAYVDGNRMDHIYNLFQLIDKYPRLRIVGEDFDITTYSGKGNKFYQEHYYYFGVFTKGEAIIDINEAAYEVDDYRITDKSTETTSNEWINKKTPVELEISKGKVIVIRSKFD